MKPWRTVAVAQSTDHERLELRERDGEWVIRVGARDLMSSRQHGSEEDLARIGCASLPPSGARVLVGGLGMGFTLRAALDRAPADAEIVVAEISSAVIEWNRAELGPLSDHAALDPRVRVEHADVADVARTGGGFDAILLDVDNGPEALARASNRALYEPPGLRRLGRALRPGGVLAIWSAGEAPALAKSLERAGFDATVVRVASSPARGARKHVVLRAAKRAAGADTRSTQAADRPRVRPPRPRDRG